MALAEREYRRQLKQFMNPQRPAWVEFLMAWALRFFVKVIVIFGFYAVVFAWALLS